MLFPSQIWIPPTWTRFEPKWLEPERSFAASVLVLALVAYGPTYLTCRVKYVKERSTMWRQIPSRPAVPQKRRQERGGIGH